MTQAFNLSQFANNVNSSGQASNGGLQNSSVTVTAGTGMSGGGAVALGSSVTLNNAGVTSVTAGTGISVSASTGGVTISSTGTGVTSITAGNGISVNTNTGAVTVTNSLYSPTGNGVGTYVLGQFNRQGNTYIPSFGSNYSVGSGGNQVTVLTLYDINEGGNYTALANWGAGYYSGSISGTWKWLGNDAGTNYSGALMVRIA
jgi:hypothetical protein